MDNGSTTDAALRLGAYLLPGRAAHPLPALDQARAAEALGLGSVWVSERWDTKEVASLCGAVSQVAPTPRIVTGVTHFGTRHPMVLAAMGTTMQGLTGGRFVMGFGRSAPHIWERFGVPAQTSRLMADTADLLRRLWRGEVISYDGPAGRFPQLRMEDVGDIPAPPLLLTAVGPKTLALAGRHFDGVVLHPFLTTDAVTRSAEVVRAAAMAAGRDPSSVKIYATVIISPDRPPEEEAASVVGRAVTYFSSRAYGLPIVEANRWDPGVIDRVARHPRLAAAKAAPAEAVLPLLADVGKALPDEWLVTGAAVGTATACASRLHAYLAAGADELLLHATTPDHYGSLVERFRDQAGR